MRDASRGKFREYLVQALLLAVLLAAAFPAVLMRGEWITPAELLFRQPPWQGYAPEGWSGPRNPLMADPITLFHAWYTLGREAVLAGDWPLWNHREFGGLPLLANYQSAMLYPPRLLHLAFATGLATTLFVLLKLWLSGMAGYACARVMGLGVPAARFFSAAWMLSSYNLIWCNWVLPDLSPWLAVLALGAELLFRGHLTRGFFATAAGATLLLLAGHPVSAFTMVLGLHVYLLLRTAVERRWGRSLWEPVGLWAMAWALAAGVAAAQLIPFAEYMLHKYQGHDVAAFGSEPGLPLSAAAVFFLPRFFGTAADGNYWGDLDSNRYSMIYPGMVVWIAIGLTLSRGNPAKGLRARTAALAGAALFCALMAFDAYPLSLLNALPFLGDIKRSYHVCFAVFALPLLAAHGLDRWFARPRRVTELWPGVAVLSAAGLVVWGVWSFNGRLITMQQMDPYLQTQGWLAAGFGLVAVLLVAAGLTGRGARIWTLGLTALVACDLLVATRGLNPTLAPRDAYPETALIRFLGEMEPPARVGVAEGGIPGGIMASYGIEEWLGEDGMYPARMLNFLKGMGKDIWVAAEPACAISHYLHDPRYDPVFPMDTPGRFTLIAELDGLQVYRNEWALSRAYLVSALEVVEDPGAMFERMRGPDFDPRRVALVEAMPRGWRGEAAPEAFGAARVVERDATRVAVEVSAERDAVLVLADAYYPGWAAEVNGAPTEVFPVNHAFRGVTVPAGVHTVEFRYAPSSFRAGLAVSIASMLCGLAAALLSLGIHARHQPAGGAR